MFPANYFPKSFFPGFYFPPSTGAPSVLTVTINQAAGQADPTSDQPINFTVIFSGSVADFTSSGVALSGTAGPVTAVVTGSGTTYNVAVSGMTQPSGTVIATIPAGVAHDSGGTPNNASTSTDNTVTWNKRPNLSGLFGGVIPRRYYQIEDSEARERKYREEVWAVAAMVLDDDI